MATIDLSQILSSVNNQNYSSQSVADTIISDTNSVEAAGTDKINAIQSQANNQIIVTGAEESGKLQAQTNARNAASALGTNMDVASSVINSLGSQLIDNFQRANAALDSVHKKESVGFLDNPVDYITNQISLPQDKETYNYYANKYNLAESTLASLNALTQSTVQTQNAIAQIRTAASAEAATQLVQDKANQQAAEVKQQNLLYNIQGLKIVQDINQQGVDLMFKAQGALVSQENLDIARQHLELSRQKFALELQDKQEKIDQKAIDRAEIEELGKTINDGRSSLGLAPIPVGRAVQLMKMGGDTGNQIKYQYSIGAMQASVGKPIIAETPGMAGKVVVETQAPLSSAMKPVKDLITSVYSQAATGNLDKKIDIKNEGQVIGAANTALINISKNMAANIKQGDNTNIYQAPDLISVTNTTSVQESVLYQKVLAPAIQAGGLGENNPDLIISLATNAAKKGTISYEDAVQGITNYYKQVTLLNNQTKDYVRVGLPPQKNYVTELTDPSGFSNKYDLTNPTMVSNLVSKKLAGYRLGAGGSIFGFN